MKTALKILFGVAVACVAAVVFARYWYLSWDEIAPPELPGVVANGALQHDGQQRQWLAYVPASRRQQAPLLVFLRGSGSDGAMARSGTFYSFDVLAEREGFVVTYPTGFERHWNGCRAAATYAANLQQIDDVGFIRRLVAEMEARYDIDPSRVFAAGMSNGGHMVYRLAYEAPDLIAGAAVLMANLPTENNSECTPVGEPVPMLLLTGTEDAINPYAGGDVNVYGEHRGAVQSAQASARYWAGLAGYTGNGERLKRPETSPDDGTSIESLSWTEPSKVPVTLVSIVGGGHTFPNPVYSAPRILGVTSHEADAAELVWAFFNGLKPKQLH
ncbi:MAG: PHB depolymerase family esterase [Halioglobus sp.]